MKQISHIKQKLAIAVAYFLIYWRMYSHLLVFRWFAAPGRMALTNYIGQSVAGMFIFYGIGLGLGSEISLLVTELMVVMIYIALQSFSSLWFVFFRFGPLEWIWRILTYGHWIGCRKQNRV